MRLADVVFTVPGGFWGPTAYFVCRGHFRRLEAGHRKADLEGRLLMDQDLPTEFVEGPTPSGASA